MEFSGTHCFKIQARDLRPRCWGNPTSKCHMDFSKQILLNGDMPTSVHTKDDKISIALNFSHILLFTGLFTGALHSTAHAQLPFDHLSERVLREPNPFSFIKFNSNVDLAEEDFVMPDANMKWIPNSFQWGRVSNAKDEAGILIPRARATDASGKQIEVALTQVDNPIKIKFRPRATLKTRYYFDSSCSSFNLKINEAKLEHSWVIVTCHRINNGTNSLADKPVLLATVLWENEVNGTLTQISLDSEHPKQKFGAGGVGTGSSNSPLTADSFELEASIAPQFHHLGLSAGIGPYSSRNVVKPFITIYGSYFFNDALKIASFAALPIRPSPEIDWGGYLVMEQFRGVDERISLNLLLGAHLLSYVSSTGERTNAISGPQGIELIFRDLFCRNMNFMFGGFFYPKINERSYLNAWVRYGTNSIFAELNFIEWQEPNPYFYSKSFGLSIGFPLFRAL